MRRRDECVCKGAADATTQVGCVGHERGKENEEMQMRVGMPGGRRWADEGGEDVRAGTARWRSRRGGDYANH